MNAEILIPAVSVVLPSDPEHKRGRAIIVFAHGSGGSQKLRASRSTAR